MSDNSNAPIIVKRKSVRGGDAHHGGAWKVAYADFVTAMMAFFMLMWLLNATTEKQRKGIADYFNPTIPVNRISGGGEDMFGGDSIFSDYTLARNGTGGRDERASKVQRTGPEDQAAAQAEEQLASELMGIGGESDVASPLKRHIRVRTTDRGLVVELFDVGDRKLFLPDTAELTKLGRQLVATVGEVFAQVPNRVSVTGHVASRPVVLAHNPNWDLSTSRAHASRTAMEASGLDGQRVARVTGAADRVPATYPRISSGNNRIEIVLLRDDVG